MFASLSQNLGKVFDKLRGRGLLTEENINEALREIRIALLEADVSLSAVKEFINKIKEKAVGTEVIKSISPAQMIVKIVSDELAAILGSNNGELNLNVQAPAVIMMLGLQGSGKTTSSAKLALHLRKKFKTKILLASLDVYRPAAQHQLEILSKQVDIDCLPIIEAQRPLAIAERAYSEAKVGSYDVLILDTAGRLHTDQPMIDELKTVKNKINPIESLLVVDALTGQDAVNIGREFHEKIGITGVIMTRLDGDSKGGAALSMRHVTGQAIKFVGIGEKLNEFEEFHPERAASRILDMGDIVSLVEKAAEFVNTQDAEKMAKKLRKGQFDLNDLLSQLKSMKKMGGISSMLSMLPGMGKLKNQLSNATIDENVFSKQEAIISSMTSREKSDPKILNASRKVRIAKGAGVQVQDINKLLKQFAEMSTMMKKFGKMDQKQLSKFGKMFNA